MDDINKLYKILKSLSNIKKIESKEDEAYLLSLTLIDIEESINEILILLKDVRNSNDSEDIIGDLSLIGEELRHIIYHVRNSKYYDYLMIDDFQSPYNL